MSSEHIVTIRKLKAAYDEIRLLDLIQEHPGESIPFFARRLGRSTCWTHETLSNYLADGLVRVVKRPKPQCYAWYLED